MMRWSTFFRAASAAFLTAALVGCGNANRNLASNSKVSGGLWSIAVSSPAFRDGREIPAKYTEDGENVSPPLRWTSGPSGTVGYVVIVEDPDAGKKKPALHWMVYHIPFGTNELPENASASTQFAQGKNYKGQVGYTGPNPSKGNTHHYHFQVFAVERTSNLPAGATREELEKAAIQGAIAKGELIGTYGK